MECVCQSIDQTDILQSIKTMRVRIRRRNGSWNENFGKYDERKFMCSMTMVALQIMIKFYEYFAPSKTMITCFWRTIKACENEMLMYFHCVCNDTNINDVCTYILVWTARIAYLRLIYPLQTLHEEICAIHTTKMDSVTS